MIHTSLEGLIEQEVYEIENHFHNNEKWFGLAGTPSGETHRADRVTLKPNGFQIDAGNDTWSAWLQILGSSDTPVETGKTRYDFHRILILSHERNSTPHTIQIACGESSGLAARLTAENFTEIPFITPSAPGGQNEPLELKHPIKVSAEKVWARIWAKGADTGTLDFWIGLHEYDR